MNADGALFVLLAYRMMQPLLQSRQGVSRIIIFEENPEVEGKVAELRVLVEKVMKKVWRRANL
jgi:hypothetical protein